MKEKERFEKMEKLLANLELNPLITKLRDEDAAALLCKRKAAASRIEVLRKEKDDIVTMLRTVKIKAELKYKEAKAALDVAANEFNAAKYALSMKCSGFDHRIQNHEAYLIESANPIIDETIEYFNAKLEWLRSPGRISRNAVGSERNILTWKKTIKEESNYAAVHASMKYCQASIKSLDLLKLSPELDLEVIDRMKADVPSIDVYIEESAELNMERGEPDPLHRGIREAVDSEMNWKKGVLMAKVDALLSKPAKKKLRNDEKQWGNRMGVYEQR